MEELLASLLNVEDALALLDPTAVVYLALMLALLVAAKWVHDRVTPYAVVEQLVRADNPAVAIVYAGYILGLGVILQGVLVQEPAVTGAETARRALQDDVLATIVWGAVGIAFLEIARYVNDTVLLRKFCNTKELVEDRNVGTAAVELGSLVGTSLIVRAVLQGEDAGLLPSLVAAVVYFAAGQLAFIAFGAVYERVVRYDVHAEIERDNVAAGISFGASLLAVGVLISSYLVRYDSVLGLALWIVISGFLLLVSRYLLDKWVLPGSVLDEEIARDRNWGAAMVEGGAALAVAFLLGTAF
jgi:uncharacterized membrane protein YjfL (UPF0719 family)